MITEDYVSFETAKLLKEKGFDEKGVKVWYDESGEMYYDRREIKYQIKIENHEKFFQCPTLQMAMKWLREVHHIFIVFNVAVNGIYFSFCTYKELSGDGTINYKPQPVFPTYKKAAEAAIKYCLENLI